ncbi:hypothetical protein LCGC14_2250070 [marine sediment metagenome]|uniref:Uncharacterized protein n=1 Tax=marine sediment metagenome TaxID=412755 RepID=A0A0F9FXV5_9ZZZZ
MKTYTHDELVEKAKIFLKRQHCVVITEMAGGSGEEADAIGWGSNGVSTLIECKASRADFIADKRKWFRREPHRGMAGRRYYLTNKGIVKPADIPEYWGLIEPSGRGVKVILQPTHQPHSEQHGVQLLLSAIRRIGRNAPESIAVKFYTYQTGCIATMGVGYAESD